jgi:plastocyanin
LIHLAVNSEKGVMRFTATAVALLAVAGFASGCAGSGGGNSPQPTQPDRRSSSSNAVDAAPAVESASVDIASFKFKPMVVAVKKGGRITWSNSDSAEHTATADDRSFDTQTIDRGQSKSVMFSSSGTFAYHCDFHPFMKATVVVR